MMALRTRYPLWAVVVAAAAIGGGCDRSRGAPPRPAAAVTDAGASAARSQATADAEVATADAAAPVVDPAEVHAAAIVIDTHNDVTLRLVDEPGFDFGRRSADGHTDLVRMRAGGLDAQFLSVWVKPRDYQGEPAWERSMAMFDAIEATARRLEGEVVLARTASEVRAAATQGKVALLIGVEGAHALGEPSSPAAALARIRRWRQRGAAYLTLTWMNTNALAGSSGDWGRTKGLTPLGRRAVAMMNDLGMIIDVSHCSDPTVTDVLEASRLPVLASHSGVRALSDHYRNLSDEHLRVIAAEGGAVCIVYYPGYLDSRWAAARRRARRTGREMEADPVLLSKVVDHIDHAVEVAGVEHVCLGSDFDGIGAAPVGLEDVSKLPALTAELLRRGYDQRQVQLILGENVLRVLEANEGGASGAAPAID